MSSRHDADILILGAGPAGCAAAISARQAGLRVMLVESLPEPRIAPGETLHPGVEVIFRQLGVWEKIVAERFHRHVGVWKESADKIHFEAYGADEQGSWLGIQAERKRLHRILQGAAVEIGCPILRSTTPCEVLKESARVVGVATDRGEFRARWVLDATGNRSWLAEALGLPAETKSPRARVGFGWKESGPKEADGQPRFRQYANGWDWLAPQGNWRSAWVRLRFLGSLEETTTQGGGMACTWRIHRLCSGAGYMLLGDAAALLDPGASNGVLRALMSGIYATYLIMQSNQGRIDECSIIRTYAEWVGDWFDHHSKELGRVYFSTIGLQQ